MLINQIARAEFRNALADRRFSGLAALVGLLLTVALLTGWTNYRQQTDERETLVHLNRAQWDAQDAKNPHSAAHYGNFVFRPKPPLSLLDAGLDQFTGTSIYLEPHKQNLVNFAYAQEAMSLVRLGELTVAFILQTLLPLLIIFLGFGAVSGEREGGTLKLLAVQGASVRAVGWGKIGGLARLLGLVLGPVVLVSIGLVAFSKSASNSSSPADEVARLGLWWLAYAAYGFVWIAATVVVSARSRSSRASLLTLLAVWMLACVLIPKITANIGDNLMPTPSRVAFQNAIAQDLEKGMDGHNPADARREALKRQLLKKYGVDTTSKLPINFNGLAMYESEKYTTRVYNHHFGSLQQTYASQNAVSGWAGPLNPFLALHDLSQGLAATDYLTFVDFQQRAEDYRLRFVNNLNHYLAYQFTGATAYDDMTASQTVLRNVPSFTYEVPGIGFVLGQYGLAVLSLALWVGLSVWFVNQLKTVSPL